MLKQLVIILFLISYTVGFFGQEEKIISEMKQTTVCSPIFKTNSDMKKALLIIDIQNDYFPDGKYPLYQPIETAQRAKQVLEKCRKAGIPIIHVQHINSEGAPFFVKNSEGVNIHELVKPLDSEKVVTKNYPNSFRDTTLQKVLDDLDIEQLIIVGMMTHMCIDTTTRAAKDLGYDCIVLADCCTTKDLIYKEQTVSAAEVQITYMSSLSHFFANVIESQELIL